MSLGSAVRRLGELLAPEREAASPPVLVMLAGSNGAGKSTFYDAYLAQLGLPFVNADRIAVALTSGERPWPGVLANLPPDAAAQKLADEEREASIVLGRSFITETVLSDPVGAKVRMLVEARERGMAVWLFFIGISSPHLSLARVRERVESRAGHDVPADRIRARFARTLRNLPRAVAAAGVAVLLDNDLAEQPYRFVALFENGKRTRTSRLKPAWAAAVLREKGA
jgi:predicted ABC-type ATPase